jgi:O-acetyl-ADP-ribose deacetylase (regulator of RNase III)
VIHAAGMPPGGSADESSVRSALRASLALADEHGCHSLAVPAVGAGVGGLSLQRCAEISLEEARRHLASGRSALAEIRFVLFGEPAYRIFEMVNDAARVEAQMQRLQKR